MVSMICNYQSLLLENGTQELNEETSCEACGISADELQQAGKSLEICGAEHYSDPVSGERFMIPVALCPECHLENHREASGRLNPCHVAAARSWAELVKA